VSTSPVRIDPGCEIGPYVVERRLAQGGMSVLWVARDPQLRREVVLKVVPDELSTQASRARLLREARALAALDHPGIVRVFASGEHQGTPWIAMEYVRGIDLKRLVAERGPVPQEKALRWVAQAAEALGCAHDAGVIHRDLKPSNLLVGPDDRIKIVDFGIAKKRTEAQREGDVLTSQREVVGTPAYLSPEQLEHGLADERSDVWALGCVLYELCVGTPPFGRGNSATTVAAILRDEPAFPSHVGAAVAAIVSACLRKSSFARIASARELLALLRDAIDDPATVAAEGHRASARLSSRPTSVTPPPVHRPSQRPSAPPPRSSSIRASTSPPSSAAMASSSSYPRASLGRIKGTAIRAGLTWYASSYGATTLARVYELASPELRAMLRPDDAAFGVIASGWYDTPAIGELLEHLEKLADPEDREAYANALTTAIAKDNVGGIYRSLFRLISTPSMLEANAQRVWRTYLDEGTCIAKVPAAGKIAFEVTGWGHHQPTVCRVVGYMMQNVLRAVGYTALIVERTHCVADGDGLCAYDGMYLA
jgi:serine/threonine protein kinase